MMDIEKLNCIGCHHMHPDNGNCTAAGGFCTAVPASYCPLIPELRAENEKLRAGLERVKKLYESEKEDFIDYACSGVPNLSPYCMNRRPDCVDERGWCRSEKCHGFSRERGHNED